MSILVSLGEKPLGEDKDWIDATVEQELLALEGCTLEDLDELERQQEQKEADVCDAVNDELLKQKGSSIAEYINALKGRAQHFEELLDSCQTISPTPSSSENSNSDHHGNCSSTDASAEVQDGKRVCGGKEDVCEGGVRSETTGVDVTFIHKGGCTTESLSSDTNAGVCCSPTSVVDEENVPSIADDPEFVEDTAEHLAFLAELERDQLKHRELLEQIEKEEAERQRKQKERASVLIQTCYRGYRLRKTWLPVIKEKVRLRKEEERLERERVEREKQRLEELRRQEEEEKRRKLEEERKRREEEEKRRLEAERERRAEEERRKREEAEKRKRKEERKKKQEEERQKREEEERRRMEKERKKEEEERKRRLEEERLKKKEEERKKREEEERKKKEEEERKRLEEKRKRMEEERKWKEEEKRKKEEEEERRKREEEEEKKREERRKLEEEMKRRAEDERRKEEENVKKAEQIRKQEEKRIKEEELQRNQRTEQTITENEDEVDTCWKEQDDQGKRAYCVSQARSYPKEDPIVSGEQVQSVDDNWLFGDEKTGSMKSACALLSSTHRLGSYEDDHNSHERRDLLSNKKEHSSPTDISSENRTFALEKMIGERRTTATLATSLMSSQRQSGSVPSRADFVEDHLPPVDNDHSVLNLGQTIMQECDPGFLIDQRQSSVVECLPLIQQTLPSISSSLHKESLFGCHSDVQSNSLQHHKAATLIQAVVRGYLLRKHLAAALALAHADCDSDDDFDDEDCIDMAVFEIDENEFDPDFPHFHPLPSSRLADSGDQVDHKAGKESMHHPFPLPPVRPPSRSIHPHHAWTTPSPRQSVSSSPLPPSKSHRLTSNPAGLEVGCKSQLSQQQEAIKKLQNEWGFSEQTTVKLMWRRAKRLQRNAQAANGQRRHGNRSLDGVRYHWSHERPPQEKKGARTDLFSRNGKRNSSSLKLPSLDPRVLAGQTVQLMTQQALAGSTAQILSSGSLPQLVARDKGTSSTGSHVQAHRRKSDSKSHSAPSHGWRRKT